MEDRLEISVTTHRLYTRIEEIMRDRKPYLDPRLTLGKLARIVATNRSCLSETLNNVTKMNFSRWLSTYRVQHFITLARQYPEKSLEELSTDSGFSSRTTFFRQFQDITGQTPKEYRQTLTSIYSQLK